MIEPSPSSFDVVPPAPPNYVVKSLTALFKYEPWRDAFYLA